MHLLRIWLCLIVPIGLTVWVSTADADVPQADPDSCTQYTDPAVSPGVR